MKQETISKWLQQLEGERILTRSVRDNTTFFHLETPTEFSYSPVFIGEIQKHYDSKFEKGGYILFEPTIVDEKVILTATEIVWIKNISETPADSYRIATAAHHNAEEDALSRMLLPIRFHTHPTHSLNIVQSQVNFLYQLGTSDADKRWSFLPIKVGQYQLILPDKLVVGREMDESIFIGVYNGLITPIDFESHKRKVQAGQMESFGERMSVWLESDRNKAIAIVGLLIFIGLAVRFPKAVGTGVLASGIMLQDFSMRFKEDSSYFGIATPKSPFKIGVPKVTPDIVIENDKVLNEILKRLSK